MCWRNRLLVGLLVVIGLTSAERGWAASCVWKVTSSDGHLLYLGGSVHGLRPTDYPLPPQYNSAFEACSRLAFEEDPKTSAAASKGLLKAGQYPKNDGLKNHVDPRTYEYLRHFFSLRGVPEEKYANLRPWLIDLLLIAPPPQYYQLGIERFLERRAAANSKPISGLESTKEHYDVLARLSDRQAEALMLITFINAGRDSGPGANLFEAWHRGEVELLTASARDSYRDFPLMADRFLTARNRNWIPKIEGYLRSGKTYFVVAGAAHMGGHDGVPALLKARGYKVEQL
jgi:uncharacterized protein